MRIRGALLWNVGEPWSVEEIDIGEPSPHEVAVRLEAAGLCHSDHHFSTGASPTGGFPVLGGHEGAGVIVGVGSDVEDIAVGQHVVLSCVPSCGACPNCQQGLRNLCDRADAVRTGRSVDDSTFRVRARGRDVYPIALLGAFAPYAVVHRASVIPVDPAVPFEVACLLGCAVATGWGAATRTAGVRPGDDVVVIGLGGVGMAALRGAVASGGRHVIVIDPVQWKREKAVEWGATQAFPDIASAIPHVAQLTGGYMAHRVIVAVGEPDGRDVDNWLILTAKGGSCVLASLADSRDFDITVHLAIQVLMQKRLQGSLLGGGDLRYDTERLVSRYLAGRLPLDEFVTRRYTLDEINDGFRDMLNGDNIRGVIRYTDTDWGC